MAEPVVSIVLETFHELLIEEVTFLCGVGGQVKELEAELTRLKSFLKDSDARQHEDDLLRTCVQQIRILAYRAEDVLEKYKIKVMSKRESPEGCRIRKLLQRFACCLNEGVSLHEVGMEISGIKAELANVRNSLRAYGVNPVNKAEKAKEKEEKQRLLRQTFAHTEDKDFVGMEDDMKELVSLVLDEKKDRVISIFGMGGLGKTKLARKTYNHPDVKRAFDGFAWVCITQKCETKSVLRDLLKQLTKKDMQDSCTINELMRDIFNVLQRKKCLVVIDDVWEVDDWTILSAPLPKEGPTKVLLTTRKEEVAQMGFLHRQRLLNEEEGLELLRRKTFGQNGNNDPEIEEVFLAVGKRMLCKCGGLPLAISSLGGILKNKLSRDLQRLPFGGVFIDNDFGSGLNLEETVRKVISFSYDDLPHFLKPCFMYMGVFREDESINLEKLYVLCIAVAKYDVHANRLDISLNLGYGSSTCFDPLNQITNQYVRALFVEVLRYSWLHTIKTSLVNFGLLRVLDFSGCKFYERKLPNGIGELFHLRYLSVCNCDVEELPSSVGELPFLLTLDLRTSSRIKIAHDMFSKKRPLKHLYLGYFTCGVQGKLHLDGLSELETLCVLVGIQY